MEDVIRWTGKPVRASADVAGTHGEVVHAPVEVIDVSEYDALDLAMRIDGGADLAASRCTPRWSCHAAPTTSTRPWPPRAQLTLATGDQGTSPLRGGLPARYVNASVHRRPKGSVEGRLFRGTFGAV